MIVTVTATIMDGTVVRWYQSLSAAETHRPVLSASRHGVRCEVYLHEIPGEVLRTAHGAHEALRRDRGADLTHLATHRNRGPSNGPLIPVDERG